MIQVSNILIAKGNFYYELLKAVNLIKDKDFFDHLVNITNIPNTSNDVTKILNVFKYVN